MTGVHANTQGHSLRILAASALIYCAVALLCVFYGMPKNAVVFFLAVLAVLLAASLLGPQRLAHATARQPIPSALALIALVLLVVNYQFSQSKDSGFAPTWSLALLPLTFLVVRELGGLGWRLHGAVTAMVGVFAGLSVWNYFLHGTRPALPLTDLNNYCTLIYMVLLPGCYSYLRRVWQGQPVAWYWHLGMHLGAGLLLLVVFATESHAGAVIVASGLAIFLGLAVSRRLRLLPVIALICLAGVLYFAVDSLRASEGLFNPGDISEGAELRVALNTAALDVYRQHPLIGAGINLFPVFYRMSRNLGDQETAGLSPHNDYLQLLAEGGPLLLLVLLGFAAGVGVRFLRVIFPRARPLPDASFGVLLALGAALAHAAINFVLLTSVLACFLGLSAALVPWQKSVEQAATQVRRLRMVMIALLSWGWLSFAYLGLDVFSLGVYEAQTGVPFAGYVRQEPERVLAYSKFVQAVNSDRGVPVLAEAVHHQARLAQTPDSPYLQDLTLATFRRARQVDPWNPYALLQMHGFVTAHPAVQGKLVEGERPFDLLLRAIQLDPLLLPAYDRIISELEAQGRGALAYKLVREKLAPWLVWLGLRDPDAAAEVMRYLQGWATREGDAEYQRELQQQAALLARQEFHPRQLWFR